MAGLYPDVPSWRIPWDRDGTQVFYNQDNVFDPPIGPLTAGQMQTLNNESDDGVVIGGGTYNFTLMFLFPQPMNLYGGFIATDISSGATGGPQMLQKSVDTTNGVDGTWVDILDPADQYQTNPYWRTAITTFTALGIKAIRFRGGNLYTKTVKTVHWFGEVASGNPDRLEFWHPTLDQRAPAAWFDMAECARGSSADVQFRIKNLSPTLTANTVTVSAEALTDTTPSVPAAHLFDYNGGGFGSSAAVSSLLPGGISSLFTIRRTTPTTATLSLWAFRMKAIAASWT